MIFADCQAFITDKKVHFFFRDSFAGLRFAISNPVQQSHPTGTDCVPAPCRSRFGTIFRADGAKPTLEQPESPSSSGPRHGRYRQAFSQLSSQSAPRRTEIVQSHLPVHHLPCQSRRAAAVLHRSYLQLAANQYHLPNNKHQLSQHGILPIPNTTRPKVDDCRCATHPLSVSTKAQLTVLVLPPRIPLHLIGRPAIWP